MKKPRRTPPRRLSPELRERRAEAFESADRPPREPREPRARDGGESIIKKARGKGEGARAQRPQTPQTPAERPLRIHGLNAVLALWPSKADQLRRLYLRSSRAHELGWLLRELAQRNIAYRIVGEDDLRRLTGTEHHQGIAADLDDEGLRSLEAYLRSLPAENAVDAGSSPRALLWLDGVMNPHNLGAILRSAAHFGVDGILIAKDSPLARPSGAIARVAEGGLFAMPRFAIDGERETIDALRGAGFELFATVVDGGDSLFDIPLPPRLVFMLGAEGEGMSETLRAAADRRLTIPGSGAVESLNVSAAMAVFFAAFRTRYPLALDT